MALPKGRLLRSTAAVLQRAGWALDEYHSDMGFYRPHSKKFPELLLRVFHEKDIPVQIAMGNYDLGICGLDWIEELLAKYPSSGIVKVKDLAYGAGALYIASAAPLMGSNGDLVRIATEYPNLAEAYALQKRLGRFAVFPVWGAAEVYPPENADMALISTSGKNELSARGLVSSGKVLDYSAFLIASRHSWETKHLDKIIASVCSVVPEVTRKISLEESGGVALSVKRPARKTPRDMVRLALPDGHQQQHAVELLNRAGIRLEDYPSATGNRRPAIAMDGVTVKVIRPQDMPLQVANRNIDLAITGKDWLADHLAQFPSSPVREILNFKSGKVRLVAVVSRDLPVANANELGKYIESREQPVRIASEYMNLADKYARENHLGRYRVIPTWGATEAFLPDDADMLIENTETGRTIARHNLKIIDTLFESTGCLIGPVVPEPARRAGIRAFVAKISAVLGNG
jgi:ATP phosphoribosyltransferase